MPVPHVVVQVPQLLQLPTQFTGHDPPHDWDSTALSVEVQAVPPPEAAVVMSKVRELVPAQVAEQVLQVLQEPTQFTDELPQRSKLAYKIVPPLVLELAYAQASSTALQVLAVNPVTVSTAVVMVTEYEEQRTSVLPEQEVAVHDDVKDVVVRPPVLVMQNMPLLLVLGSVTVTMLFDTAKAFSVASHAKVAPM